MTEKVYVQYGCGLCAPVGWINFDASPTLQIQRIPLLGKLFRKKLNVIFPVNVKYGDIIKGLPIKENSCDAIFCSHTLEHLSLADFGKALKNTYTMLKSGGMFRCIVPDLEYAAREYIQSIDRNEPSPNMKFMQETMLGVEQRPKGMKGLLNTAFGNSHHLWMWDRKSLSDALADAGFHSIRQCRFNDCEDEKFIEVEYEGRFINAVAIECIK